MLITSIILPISALVASVAAHPAASAASGGVSLNRRGLVMAHEDEDDACVGAYKTKKIQQELNRALGMVNWALKIQPEDEEYKLYMDQSSDKKRYLRVMKHFQRMKDLLDPESKKKLPDVPMVCGDSDTPSCKGTYAIARSYKGTPQGEKPKVHPDIIQLQELMFCPRFFGEDSQDRARNYVWPTSMQDNTKGRITENNMCKAGRETFDLWADSSPARIIIHELSHLHFGDNANFKKNNFGDVTDVDTPATLDCVYGAYWARMAAQFEPALAEVNADNYAWLAMARFVKTACKSDKVHIQKEEPENRTAEGNPMGNTFAEYKQCRGLLRPDGYLDIVLPEKTADDFVR